MKVGRVVGTVVSTRKDPELSGLKFLIVKTCDFEGRPTAGGASVVAADSVGAGLGEVVLYASGSSARQTSA